MSTLTKPVTKARMAYLDLFRLIAAVAVVVIHITASAIGKYQQGSSLQLIITLINGLALFAVPAFIFISAYTFMVIYRGKTLSYWQFLKKRTAVLLIPYLLWSLVYYLDQIYFAARPFSLLDFAKALMTGSAFYHLYFMPIIFQFYLLFVPLKWITEKVSPLALAVLTLMLYYIYTSGLPFADTNDVMGSINAWLPLKSDFKLSDRLFMSYFPFYMFGLIMGLYAEKTKRLLGKFSLIAITFYLATTFFHVANRTAYYVYQSNFPVNLRYAWELSAFAAILIILWLVQQFEPYYSNSKSIPLLSAYTFDLYLAHPLILQFGEILLRRMGIQSVSLTLVLVFIMAISLPFVFAHYKSIVFKYFKSKMRMG